MLCFISTINWNLNPINNCELIIRLEISWIVKAKKNWSINFGVKILIENDLSINFLGAKFVAALRSNEELPKNYRWITGETKIKSKLSTGKPEHRQVFYLTGGGAGCRSRSRCRSRSNARFVEVNDPHHLRLMNCPSTAGTIRDDKTDVTYRCVSDKSQNLSRRISTIKLASEKLPFAGSKLSKDVS